MPPADVRVAVVCLYLVLIGTGLRIHYMCYSVRNIYIYLKPATNTGTTSLQPRKSKIKIGDKRAIFATEILLYIVITRFAFVIVGLDLIGQVILR